MRLRQCGRIAIDVAVAGNDDVFVIDADNRSIGKIAPVNARNVVSVVVANLEDPRALAIDEAGNLYVAEGSLHVIKRIRPTGEISVIAGQPGLVGFTPGALPGVLALPSFSPTPNRSDPGNMVGLKVRNNRLVMTMEKVVVEISPLPK